MRLVKERVAATAALADSLESTRVTRDHLRELKTLIEEETESKDRSERSAERSSHVPYVRSMQSAAANSWATLGYLNDAMVKLRQRDGVGAAALLRAAATHRDSAKDKTRNTNLSKLYTAYLMQTDKAFHAWLKDNDQHAALQQLGVAVPTDAKPSKRKVVLDGRSNAPEDYL